MGDLPALRVLRAVKARSRDGARVGQLCEDLGLKRRTVMKHLGVLADMGSIRYVEVRLTARRERLWFPAG